MIGQMNSTVPLIIDTDISSKANGRMIGERTIIYSSYDAPCCSGRQYCYVFGTSMSNHVLSQHFISPCDSITVIVCKLTCLFITTLYASAVLPDLLLRNNTLDLRALDFLLRNIASAWFTPPMSQGQDSHHSRIGLKVLQTTTAKLTTPLRCPHE